jgi:DNA-binding transcriptional MerR regulator
MSYFNQHRANIRNFLVGLTIDEIKQVLEAELEENSIVVNGINCEKETERSKYIREYLSEEE